MASRPERVSGDAWPAADACSGRPTLVVGSSNVGGFASGTTAGIRTRRYHALLLTAATPPTGRMMLVNGFDALVDTAAGTFALSTQRYAPDVLHPDGAWHITDFTDDPWPTWQFEVADSTRVSQELFVEHGTGVVVIIWTQVRSNGPVVLRARPFLSGRDYHAMHHANLSFRFEAARHDAMVRFPSRCLANRRCGSSWPRTPADTKRPRQTMS